MASEVVKKWMDNVNLGAPQGVTSLYSENSVLIPTLSNTIRINSQGIEDYFNSFLAKESLKVTLLECFTQNSSGCAFSVDSGIYVFCWKEQNEQKCMNARFNFFVDGGKILEHHSSAIPEKITAK